MILVLYLALILSAVWGQSSSPVLDPDKFTICAITINSDDEKKIFQAQAAKNPKKFNPVVELTEMGQNDWFSKACSSGIRCDQLIISGHFAGSFFGDSGKDLSLQELEKAGCSKSCEGILGQPYEVFLFGCNTLSDKEGDHRTPAQYLQVLLADGIPLAQAELVVQSRYGAVGDSNKASMQRAFSGDNKQLYGFHSVGPSGKNIKGFLGNYFSKVSAADQLEKLQAQRMMNQVNMANKALAESLKSTAFTQCQSADLKDEVSKKVCELYDERKSTGQKLDLTLELLSQENYLLYLPSINAFMKTGEIRNLNSEDQKTFDLIKHNDVLKQQILGLADKTQGFGLKSEWLTLALNLGFITEAEISKKLTSEIEKMFLKPLSVNDVDMICAIEANAKDSIQLSNDNFKNMKIGANELYAFGCLSPLADQQLVSRLINARITTSDRYVLDAQYHLAETSLTPGSTVPNVVMAYAKKKLTEPDMYEAGNALEFLSRHSPDDKAAVALAKKWASEPFVSEYDYKLSTGLRALETMKIQDPKVLGDVLKVASIKNRPVPQSLVSFLTNVKSDDKEIQRGVASLLNNENLDGYSKSIVFNSLKDQSSDDPAIHKEILKYAQNGNNYYQQNAINYLKTLSLSPEIQLEVDKLK